MDKNDLTFIQDQIGYRFGNTDLLQQAFIRRSYSKENGGENNEVLEFFGDRVLDFVVVKLLSERYGCLASECDDFKPEESWNEYICDYQENRLTEIKKRLVEKKNLARRIDDLGVAEFLIMGKSDIIKKVDEEDSVKEDLFEAILGAIAIDSNWNMTALQDSVEIMLNPDTILEDDDSDDYVELIQEWCYQKTGNIPRYHFEKGSHSSLGYSSSGIPSPWFSTLNGISQNRNVSGGKGDNELMTSTHKCHLKLGDELPIFRGSGRSKSEARKNACKHAYEHIEKEGLLFTIKDELDNPNRDEAIGQLETLSRRGYFEIPKYAFTQAYDSNGNPVWSCMCFIDGESKKFKSTLLSKKNAKKSAAFQMLEYVLKNY